MTKIKLKVFFLKILWAVLLSLGLPLCTGWCSKLNRVEDETMLMFVGEDLSVMTAASRIPESPASAPAIASVINQEDIRREGAITLSEILSRIPGFYMQAEARGTKPYLRGIANGVLFLYDGVPITMDVTKDLHPLDYELSLHNIKQVEVVRGPGSVLWGPDAFAGIVNIVPLRGKDRPGLKIGAVGGSHDYLGGYMTWGMQKDSWDMFLSGYGARRSYHDDSFIVSGPIGTPDGNKFSLGHVDPSYYVEFTGNLHVGDWLSISGRFSDFKRRYTLHDPEILSWEGERESPINYVKATITKTVGKSHISLTGYYQDIKYKITDVNIHREQENHIYGAEIFWDRRVFEKGLLTAGASFRLNDVQGALVNDGFLPDFLQPANSVFVPEIEQADYNNEQGSVFAQYRHRWNNVDLWMGVRLDKHSQYRSTFNYSFGFNWPLENDWRLKAAYGTAYRSPYSSQIYGDRSFDPEGINTFNLQLAFEPGPSKKFSFTFFYQHLTDHIQEDPYGGLSLPSDQDIYGFEFEGKARIFDRLDISGNVTFLDTMDGEVDYRSLRYTFIRPDGTRKDVYDTWHEPFYTGPDIISTIELTYYLSKHLTINLEGEKCSSIPYSFVKDTVSGSYNQPFLLGAALRISDIFKKGSMLSLKINNILDEDYHVPGLYGPVEGEGISFYTDLSLRF